MSGNDLWVCVGELRAVVGKPRRRRGERKPRPPCWLLLGARSDGENLRPTLASGSFALDARGNISSVQVTQGVVSTEILPALLEAGHHQWARRAP